VALAVVRAYLTADTLGVGLSADSRDSSQIDTLGTEHFEEAPDRAYVITAFKVSCLFATTDSVVLRLQSWTAGTIDWDTVGSRLHKIFIPDSGTSIGYPTVVKRANRWKMLGPIDATDVSPAIALTRFTNLTDESRRALKRLVDRHDADRRRGW